MLDVDSLSGRDLDAAVAEHVLGWRLCKIGKDCDGANECEVLTPTGTLPEGWQPPLRGRLHRGFFTHRIHDDLGNAVRLAESYCGLLQVSGNLADMPTLIAREVLRRKLSSST